MKLLKKSLHLNYFEQKGEKVSFKNYSFNANVNVEDSVLKEVGEEISKLVTKTIENITLNTKTLI